MPTAIVPSDEVSSSAPIIIMPIVVPFAVRSVLLPSATIPTATSTFSSIAISSFVPIEWANVTAVIVLIAVESVCTSAVSSLIV